jgi:hypothetical protein
MLIRKQVIYMFDALKHIPSGQHPVCTAPAAMQLRPTASRFSKLCYTEPDLHAHSALMREHIAF